MVMTFENTKAESCLFSQRVETRSLFFSAFSSVLHPCSSTGFTVVCLVFFFVCLYQNNGHLSLVPSLLPNLHFFLFFLLLPLLLFLLFRYVGIH